ncbi:MAG: transcriptional regulator [Actinobacteria bacterium]|nr:transcriptional regulator [Actinomycetota bacterium]
MSHPTVELDDTVHQRTRLGILAILSRGDRVEFGYLQEVLGLSAGNLSRHLTTLIEARLVTVDKGYQGRRPRTWISITKTGKNAYDGEMAILRSLLALQDAPRDEDPNASETDDVDQHPDGDREQTSS